MEIRQLAELLNQTIVPEVMGTQVNPTAIAQYNATSPEVLATQANARSLAAFLTYCSENSLTVDYDFALTEDLSNFADFGTVVADFTDDQIKTLYQNLLLGIRNVWIRDRKYQMSMPDIFIPAEEYGAVREIVMFGTADYEVYNGRSLENGTRYDQDTYIGTGEDARIYANQSVVEVRGSVPYDQLKLYFTDAMQMNKLVSGVYTRMDNTLNLGLESVVQRVVNSMIAECDNVINLVSMYNDSHADSELTATTAMNDPDFLRWASTVIKQIKKQMTKYNKIYNDESIETFTPDNAQHLTMLDMFKIGIETYLFSDTFHEEYVKGNYGTFDTVPFWQTRGNDLLPTISTAGDINVSFADGDAHHLTNVVGVLYDDWSCGVSLRAGGTNVRTHYNAKGDFLNYFYGQTVDTFIDKRAASVVFTLN